MKKEVQKHTDCITVLDGERKHMKCQTWSDLATQMQGCQRKNESSCEISRRSGNSVNNGRKAASRGIELGFQKRRRKLSNMVEVSWRDAARGWAVVHVAHGKEDEPWYAIHNVG